MNDADHERAVPQPRAEDRHSREVQEIAEVYLHRALGDPKAALISAVADGRAASALVSRGFARWGQPVRPSRSLRRDWVE